MCAASIRRSDARCSLGLVPLHPPLPPLNVILPIRCFCSSTDHLPLNSASNPNLRGAKVSCQAVVDTPGLTGWALPRAFSFSPFLLLPSPLPSINPPPRFLHFTRFFSLRLRPFFSSFRTNFTLKLPRIHLVDSILTSPHRVCRGLRAIRPQAPVLFWDVPSSFQPRNSLRANGVSDGIIVNSVSPYS